MKIIVKLIIFYEFFVIAKYVYGVREYGIDVVAVHKFLCECECVQNDFYLWRFDS